MIFCVEDDNGIRDLMIYALRASGFEAKGFSDSSSFYDALQTEPALSIFIASAVLFMGVLYDYFSGIQKNQLKIQTSLAAQGAANEGMAYFKGLAVKDYRITWISTDGIVIYDSRSDSDEMKNHLQREEIRQAIAEGAGESSRYSVPCSGVTPFQKNSRAADGIKPGSAIE